MSGQPTMSERCSDTLALMPVIGLPHSEFQPVMVLYADCYPIVMDTCAAQAPWFAYGPPHPYQATGLLNTDDQHPCQYPCAMGYTQADALPAALEARKLPSSAASTVDTLPAAFEAGSAHVAARSCGYEEAYSPHGPAAHADGQGTAVVPVELIGDQQAEAVQAWLERGNRAERQFAMQQIALLMQGLCATQLGSRLAQRALDLATEEERGALVDALRGRVREMSRNMHANYVMQKSIDILTPAEMQFMIDELRGRAVVTTRDRFGCRIVQRLVERCPSWQTEALVDEIMSDGPRLLRHPFANFVMQHILTYGEPRHRSEIVRVLIQAGPFIANHRIARHMLRHALTVTKGREREQLARLGTN